jgi:spore maturation protein SpmA
MLNKVWFALLAIGIVYGLAKGSWQSLQPSADAVPADAAERMDEANAETGDDREQRGLQAMGKRLSAATLDAAETTVSICIGLIGIMAVWLGLLHVAKEAGLVDALARLLRPLMRLVFPDVPDGHPAQGAILMNFSANMLGLDNAATPLGLKAMRELQELNPVKDTASNSMAMFLAINTSNITLVPFAIIGYRALSGSDIPADPIAGTLLVTSFSTLVAIVAARWLSRWPPGGTDLRCNGSHQPRFARQRRRSLMEFFQEILDVVSQWTIPLAILIIVCWAAYKRVPMYESFVTGAKEGFDVAVMIIPYLVAMLFVIKIFMASGIFDDMKYGLGAAMQVAGLGEYTESLDLMPLAFVRPLTGGGARGVMLEIFDTQGPDSFVGRTASIMMGSTETTFYILTIYFGAVSIAKIRHTLAACLLADLAAIVASVVLGYLLFAN